MSLLTLPPSPLYYIKTYREYFHTLLIFGDEDQTYWHYTLAAKRLSEARDLKSYHLPYWFIQKNAAQDHEKIADAKLEKLKDTTNVNYLLDLKNQNEQQLELLK